jgi:hypothetical protein
LVGATLERLIDLLIVGEDLELELPAVRDDLVVIGKKERVVIDVDDAKRVFWSWRRSWITGADLFDRLKQRYDSPMPSAALTWPVGLLVPRVRFGVLQALEEWLTVGGGAQEARDDPSLSLKIASFLASNPQDGDNIVLKHSIVRRVWDRVIRAPNKASVTPRRSLLGHGDGPLDAGIPDLSTIRADGLVDHLEGIAAALFADITRQVSLQVQRDA